MQWVLLIPAFSKSVDDKKCVWVTLYVILVWVHHAVLTRTRAPKQVRQL